MIHTSRSTVEDGQRCLRRRFWQYHYQNVATNAPGLQSRKPSLEMSIGTAVHLGCEMLVRYAMPHSPASQQLTSVPVDVLDIPIKAALDKFSEIWRPWAEWADTHAQKVRVVAAADGTYDESTVAVTGPLLSYQLAEARALIEGLIALFYYSPTGLKQLLDNYEILAVEPEVSIPFADWLTFQSRPDFIVRHKRLRLVYSIDLKTARSWDDRAEKSAAIDNQGISQALAVKQFTGENSAGEIRLVLIKDGKRKGDDGVYRATSGLIRPYKDTQAMFGGVEAYAWDSYYTCEVEHEWKWAKAGYKVNGKNFCPGGQLHKRGDSWQQVNLWEEPGIRVRDWVARLAEEEPQRLMKLCVMPVAFQRTAEELESWVRQTKFQEGMLAEGVKHFNLAVRGKDPRWTLEGVLDAHFPQSRTSCAYPYPCPAYALCHEGGAARLLDPELFQLESVELAAAVIAELGFEARVNNHPIRGAA